MWASRIGTTIRYVGVSGRRSMRRHTLATESSSKPTNLNSSSNVTAASGGVSKAPSKTFSESLKKTAETATPPANVVATNGSSNKKGWWYSAELWGGLGALAGWGMSGSASEFVSSSIVLTCCISIRQNFDSQLHLSAYYAYFLYHSIRRISTGS